MSVLKCVRVWVCVYVVSLSDPTNCSPPGSSVHGVSEARTLEWLPLPNPAAAAAKSLQSWPTPCDPTDGSPPGSPVPGILQARMLEWVAISFSSAGKWKVTVKTLSRVRLLATPWTAGPYSRGSSWTRDRTCVSVSPASAGIVFTTGTSWEAPNSCRC